MAWETLDVLERQWLEQAIIADPSAERLRLLAPWLVLSALVIFGPLAFATARPFAKPRGSGRATLARNCFEPLPRAATVLEVVPRGRRG